MKPRDRETYIKAVNTKGDRWVEYVMLPYVAEALADVLARYANEHHDSGFFEDAAALLRAAEKAERAA